MTNFIRMLMRSVFVNVFKSDAVIWWAAIFRKFRRAEPPRGFWVPGWEMKLILFCSRCSSTRCDDCLARHFYGHNAFATNPGGKHELEWNRGSVAPSAELLRHGARPPS